MLTMEVMMTRKMQKARRVRRQRRAKGGIGTDRRSMTEPVLIRRCVGRYQCVQCTYSYKRIQDATSPVKAGLAPGARLGN